MLVIMKGGRQEVSPINRNAPLHASFPNLQNSVVASFRYGSDLLGGTDLGLISLFLLAMGILQYLE